MPPVPIIAPRDQALRTKVVQPITVTVRSEHGWIPTDPTAVWTCALAIVTVVALFLPRRFAREDQKAAKTARDKAARGVAQAILERFGKRMERTVKDLQANRTPLFAENIHDAALARLLESDIQQAFGVAYSDIVRATMHVSDAAAALHGLREESNRLEQQAKDEARDGDAVMAWASRPEVPSLFLDDSEKSKQFRRLLAAKNVDGIRVIYAREHFTLRIDPYKKSALDTLQVAQIAVQSALRIFQT